MESGEPTWSYPTNTEPIERSVNLRRTGPTLPIGRSFASLFNQNLSGGGGELRPKGLPPRVIERRSNTFVQGAPVKGDFDTSRERASESLDIEVFVFSELEDEWSRLEPATRLPLSAFENKFNTFVFWTTESTTIVGKLEKHARPFSLNSLQPWQQGNTLGEFD
jgi:hypothetical protein